MSLQRPHRQDLDSTALGLLKNLSAVIEALQAGAWPMDVDVVEALVSLSLRLRRVVYQEAA